MMIRFVNIFPIWNEKDVEMVTKQKSGGVCNHYEDVWPICFKEIVNKKKQNYNDTEKIYQAAFLSTTKHRTGSEDES